MSQEFRRGRSVPRKGDNNNSRVATESPLGSPLFRRRQFTFEASDACLSGPSGPPSRASSRDSSPSGFHAIVERVCSSPKLGLRRFAVGRSGSFNDVSGNQAGGSRKSMEAKSRHGAFELCLGRGTKGACTYDVCKMFGFFDPLPPCHCHKSADSFVCFLGTPSPVVTLV